jgi:signal transduction histidine kinase
MLGGDGAALPRRGGRWRLREWRLRTKLTAVLLVPLVLAGVLGALRVTEQVDEARDLAALARHIGFAKQVGLVVHDLQQERYLVAAMLITGRAADGAVLQAQIQRVDASVSILRSTDLDADAPVGGQLASVHQAAFDRLSELPAVRQATVGPNAGARDAITAYSDLIAVLLELDRRVLDGARDPLAAHAAGFMALAVAKEQVSRQHAVLLTGILSGVLSADQQSALRTAQARFDGAVEEFGQTAPAPQRNLYSNTGAVVDRKRLLDAALDRAARKAPLGTAPGDWNAAAVGTVEAIRQGETILLNELQTDTAARSDRAWRDALWEGVVVAALLVIAVLMLIVVMRSLLQRLRTLRAAALDVADRQLPEAVEQLQSTDGAAGQTTVDPVPVHSREEIGQVARAFDTVHAQAVRLAAEQAAARNSLNDVFLNLSVRNQGLVERQRQLIDELRSRQHDPELLNSLFQVDHLAARMHRHSENLLVLAGGHLSHGVDERATVLSVLRSAVSEIEEYQRVTVSRSPAAMVAGPVVNDLVHLIAELLDNATRATPQETTVDLVGDLTEDEGLLVEIIDFGPGLPPDELWAINGWLASPPAVDASVSHQMGLFVVSTLAAKHGITVRLSQRLGNGGVGDTGITATVLLPSSLVSIDPRVLIDTQTSIDTAPELPAVTDWSGTDGQLPLQVSVIDEATAADLFSPASIDIVTSQRSRPRTAEEEWQELFGYQASQPERAPVPDPLPSSAPLVGAAALGKPPEVREEIFEMVSAWFREQQAGPVCSYQLGDTTEMPALRGGFSSPAGSAATPPLRNAHEWRSPLDEAWHAAQALRTPVGHGVTPAGLPKRRPRAHLVAGADSTSLLFSAPAGPARNPDDIRGRLSRYQRGLRVGRHARLSPDEQLTMTDIPQGLFEEDN